MKVYLGDDGGAKCGTDEPVEVVQGIHGSQATYCFVVTNTGDVSAIMSRREIPDLYR